MAKDTRFHLEFIAAALWFEEPALLDDYAIWCKTLAANLNMPDEWMDGSFRCIAETLDSELPGPEAASRAHVHRWRTRDLPQRFD